MNAVAKKRRIIIVHGIHTNDNESWMSVLKRTFEEYGFEVVVYTYGYAYALLTRFQNPGRARKLYEMIQPGDIVIGHSNGGCLAWMAAMMGAPIEGAVLINPALDCDRIMPPQVKWVNLYTNAYDTAVKIALIFPEHPWGAQGRDGLEYPDPRYIRRQTELGWQDAPAVQGHSAVLDEEVIDEWRHVFARDVLDRISKGGNSAKRKRAA